MGKLIWHDLARLVALTSATYLVWANGWGIFYRKFMLDAIGGRLGPAGIMCVRLCSVYGIWQGQRSHSPPPSSALFMAIIVKAPVVQIVNIVCRRDMIQTTACE